MDNPADLLPLVYDELRRLAAKRLRHERPGQTLDATALVHEAYLRLVGGESASKWENQAHFFAAAAEAMRRILIERARAKGRAKRGGGRRRVDLAEIEPAATAQPQELLAIDEALDRLAQHDAQAADVVKLRYFTGMSIEQTAEALGISRATAYRHWTWARVWLRREVRGEG